MSFARPATLWRRHASMAVGAALFLLALPTASRANPNQIDDLGTTKLAEMTALVRNSDSCPQVPPEWSEAFTMLLMMTPPPEEQVEEQERKVLALRDKIGQLRWCQLYAIEMEEALTIYRLMVGQ